MPMDLFSQSPQENHEPLAYRMRPRTLDEYVGQDQIIGKGRLLRRIIQADQLSSLIFYGPPGTGKTTLARVIANSTKSSFLTINAVLAGVQKLREAIESAKENRDLYGRRTILFIDEVHRWNKAQQDALLPWVENGTIILIGATTENPYFEVNPALVSRSRLFQLKPLTKADLEAIADQALKDPVRGYGRFDVRLEPRALDHLVEVSGGDARTLLNALELAVETTPAAGTSGGSSGSPESRVFPPPEGSVIEVTLETAEESIQQKALLYDKAGDYHYDNISAFIKSLRGSDPDAALYWLARMVKAGESPRFLFRRMLILASEDVGLADPQALAVVEAAAAAFDRVGLPEGQFHLTQAALYLATAPKSNSTLGYFDAAQAVEKEFSPEVPNHLRDASRDKEGFGHGEGYLYPHAFRDHWVAQQYLPRELQGRLFYQPSEQGYEKTIARDVARRREVQLETALEPPSAEVLSFSPVNRKQDQWLKRSGQEISSNLREQREAIFGDLSFRRNDRILVPFSGAGFLVWEALRRAPEGGTFVLAGRQEDRELMGSLGEKLAREDRPRIIESLEDPELPELEKILGRQLFSSRKNWQAVLGAYLNHLAPGGILSAGEIVPRLSPRLSLFLPDSPNSRELRRALLAAEAVLYDDPAAEAGWVPEDLAAAFEEAGFARVETRMLVQKEEPRISRELLAAWLSPDNSGYGRLLAQSLPPEKRGELLELLAAQLTGRPLSWERTYLFIRGEKNP